jgi:hypothetical protein
MTKKLMLVIAMLAFVALTPNVNASFTKAPTFDLVTSSSLAGATNAIYSIHLENPDQSEDAASVSITIPAGYSVNQQFITSKAGILSGSVGGECLEQSGQGSVQTTSTPGQFSMSIQGAVIGQIIITLPTQVGQGKLEVPFSGRYSVVNHGCQGDLVMGQGFFVNPSTPGTYAWAPSFVNPKSGSPVTMAPRPGLSLSVTVVGSVTTTTSTVIPEFSSALPIVFGLALTLPVAIIRKKRIGFS